MMERCDAMRRVLVTAALVLVMPPTAQAQSVADFYRGKSIELLIGGAVGGGFDLAGRTVANHIGRHIPGNPGIVVRNMPGATSLIMTNHLYNVARRDGTVIGMPTSNIPLEQRLKLISADGANARFEIERFGWIGTPVQEPQITWVWHTAPVQNVDDLRKNAVRMGATTSSADNYLLPTILNQLLGTRMQVVTGYIGQNEIFLATERGEVQGNNTGLSTSPSTRRIGCGTPRSASSCSTVPSGCPVCRTCRPPLSLLRRKRTARCCGSTP